VCIVNESECIACGACISACTYGAIEFYETPGGKKARVTPVLCKGDGLCNTKCPTGAIVLKHYLDEAILDQIDAVTELSPEEIRNSGQPSLTGLVQVESSQSRHGVPG